MFLKLSVVRPLMRFLCLVIKSCFPFSHTFKFPIKPWERVVKFHPAGTVLPLSSSACNVTPISGDRVHKCAGG